MGGFTGHVIAGVGYIAFGVMWIVQISYHYVTSVKHNTRFTPTFRYLFGMYRGWPIDVFAKIFISIFGLSCEMHSGFEHGLFVRARDSQHATMYFTFVMSGFVDLLTYYKTAIPIGTDYVAFMFPLGVEALLFYFHAHGQPATELLAHKLVIYICVLTIIAVGLEMRFQNFIATAFRSFCVILHGTWMFEVGFIVENPNPNSDMWQKNDLFEIKFVILSFVWHCGFILIFMLIVYGLFACMHRNENDLSATVNGRAHKSIINQTDAMELNERCMEDPRT